MFSSPDTQNDPRVAPAIRENAAAAGYRKLVIMPMLRDGKGIGAIHASRAEAGSFSETEIALLQTFADQAVIAIENVRLFKELEAKNHDLTTALDQQTATSEILRVISSSPIDVQPVFDAIVGSAHRLMDGHTAMLVRVVDDRLQLAALTSTSEAADAAVRAVFPVSLDSADASAHVIRTRQPYIVTDVSTDSVVGELIRRTAPLRGYRSMLFMPMLREGRAIGVIIVTRRVPGAFSNDEMALLKTFADQAVIAIENVRLFTELQKKNQALTAAHAQVTEALEQQTATSEILRVISSSPTDVQPVFDSLVTSAARLCGANDLLLLIREADVLRPAAGVGSFWQSLTADFRVPIVRGTVAARSVIDGATLHFADLATLSEADFPVGRDLQRRFGHRTVLAVPLMREGVALGTIFAMRFEVRPFVDQQAPSTLRQRELGSH